MTDNTPTSTSNSRTPSHSAYHLKGREGKKGFWTRIGSAWPHADGKGFNIEFECIPLNGRITLRVAAENKETGA